MPLGCGITAIDTDYVRPFLDASHLVTAGGRAAFVDTGTNDSVPLLLDALAAADLDVGDVDFVFLTHVHLDHAGGAGRLMMALPNARAVLHPRGARHMIDPSKLVKGSIAVYGETAFREMYGALEPIPEARVAIADDDQVFMLADRPLRALFTEGHARHHYCLHDETSAGVFTGDSFGISYREFDSDAGAFIFPTTTPVHFDPPEAHRAIDRIMGCAPDRLYLTHYSEVKDTERLADDMHARLDQFVTIATRAAQDSGRTERIQDELYTCLIDALRQHGVQKDEDVIRELLRMDVELNTMGIEFWLDHHAAS